MSERPTLTIAVACPTCGGKGIDNNERNRMIANNISGPLPPCPDCTDGTIRQAVGCGSCRFWAKEDETYGTCEEGHASLYCGPGFGCLSWQAREGA